MLFFISTLTNLKSIQKAPSIEWLIDFELNNQPLKFIVQNTLISLNQCVEDNDEILKDKDSKGNVGLKLLKWGIIFTTIFIIYLIKICY